MNSKSSYWVITLHGRPSKGKKWEKLRSQFLPKICANGQPRTQPKMRNWEKTQHEEKKAPKHGTW